MVWVKLMDDLERDQSKLCSPFIAVRKSPLTFIVGKGKQMLDFFAEGGCDHPPPSLVVVVLQIYVPMRLTL